MFFCNSWLSLAGFCSTVLNVLNRKHLAVEILFLLFSVLILFSNRLIVFLFNDYRAACRNMWFFCNSWLSCGWFLFNSSQRVEQKTSRCGDLILYFACFNSFQYLFDCFSFQRLSCSLQKYVVFLQLLVELWLVSIQQFVTC